MNSEPNAARDARREAQPIASTPSLVTRPFYWSVRRELWENRSIYIAPLVTAGVVLFGVAITAARLPRRWRAVLLLDPAQQRAHIAAPYEFAFTMILVTVFLVWLFYCLDTLYGERRDRSILFWKSLPVSDLTTVLSKATIPLVVLPLLLFAITAATQLIILLLSSAVLLMSGLSPATSSQLPLFQSWGTLLYVVVVMALWQAPIYGWLLLVSAWARRAAFLWAVVPLVAIGAVEKIAFQTTHFAAFLRYRANGWATEAFAWKPIGYFHIDPLNPLTPGKFLSSPHLWIGLAFTVACLAAAVRLRRYRGPI